MKDKDILLFRRILGVADMAFYMIFIPVGAWLVYGWKAAILITGLSAMIEYCCRHWGESNATDN